MDDRAAILGFVPQKENPYNRLLSYADKIDEESNHHLAEIKANLAAAVQLRDINVGVNHWVGQLHRYVRAYGRKFSKADHIALIKLLFEVITIPELEFSLIHRFSYMLIHLLKKKDLLSPDDLTLPWRPLHKLLHSVLYSPYEVMGLQLLPESVDDVLKCLVRHARYYFPLSATQEMLDEWRPLLCPFDVTITQAVDYMQLFLPTVLPPEHHDKGFKLWFQELMDMWDSFQNAPSWEKSLVSLFARLAFANVGHIDWTPYIPRIFTRVLRSLNLPVGAKNMQVSNPAPSPYETQSLVTWIVYMMGGKSCAIDHVEKLFKALQSFYHPSNVGRWNVKLGALLKLFPRSLEKRLHRERYKEVSWEPAIPESHKLTDSEITRFVECVKPVIFVSMFGRYGSRDEAIALKHLSMMRPELIIPTFLEIMYPAMETLTEPHRLIACMNCFVSVSRPMLWSKKWYPDGPTHVLPLLNLSLPGLDPNDIKKCLVTLQMLSTILSLVPIVDCSDAINIRSDLTEIEKEICSATAQFEDFVLQFMDRAFSLIENSAQDHAYRDNNTDDRMSAEQKLMDGGLASTFTTVIQQCSLPIYKTALKRLFNFVSNTVYEVRVAGKFASNLCRAAAKVRPAEALKLFVPHFCSNIHHLLVVHGDVSKDEDLDEALLWNMTLLSQVVHCNGSELLPYKDQILAVLKATLHLSCVQGYEISCLLLMHSLRVLTLTYPLNYKSLAENWDRPLADYLPIRDWAKPGDLENLNLKWHVPSEEELEFTSEIFESILLPELEAIKSISAENTMPREELLCRLSIIFHCLLGSSCAIPMWTDDPIQLVETPVSLKKLVYGSGPEIKLKNQNVRKFVIKTLHTLFAYMMESCEDDTKSLFQLIKIYEFTLSHFGHHKMEFDSRWKSYQVVKHALEDRLRGNKNHIRPLLVDRVMLQHELRLVDSCEKCFTQLHKEMYADLYTLSISRYSQVRKRAQAALSHSLRIFQFSENILVQEIVKNITDKDVPDHHFKGSLYLLLDTKRKCIATKRNWEILGSVWPAIVQAGHSEKPSILKVIDDLIHKISKSIESPGMELQVTDSCIRESKMLAATGLPQLVAPVLCDEDLQKGVALENTRNANNIRLFEKLVLDLVALIDGGNLTWKFCEIGVELMTLLLRHDRQCPAPAVELYTKLLVHDSFGIRKWAFHSVTAILKQQKRCHKTRIVDPFAMAGLDSPSVNNETLAPGSRPDNQWHCYDKEALPVDKEKWEKMVFVEKTHWGFYKWPREMKVYSPCDEQPPLDRALEDMNDGERHVYCAFNDPQVLEKFLGFLSMEVVKGKDKFSKLHTTLFKGLFRNFGDSLLDSFKAHLERLVSDVSHNKQESYQRCAMEILCGIIQGSKHWPFEKVERLWAWVLPLIKTALVSVSVETLNDWGKFFSMISENRDPRKLHWAFELLLDNPLSGESGSFIDSSRLFAAQNILIQQEWRISQLQHRLMDYLKPHYAHQYKNVRDRVGSMLSILLMYDYRMNPSSAVDFPLRKDFINDVLPRLETLRSLAMDGERSEGSGNDDSSKAIKENENSLQNHVVAMETDQSNGESEERQEAIRLCKTVLKWLSQSLGRMYNTVTPEVLELIPVICILRSETKDDELKHACSFSLACLAHSLLRPDVIPMVLAKVKEVAALTSWHARSAILGYVQVMVFMNFFLLEKAEYVSEIREIVLRLLGDEQLEVREMASITLSGLIQCQYLHIDKPMLDHFECLSNTKVKKRSQTNNTSLSMDALTRRHAGVLGLSACVQAYPYDVPDTMPLVLMDLTNHINDPQPIQSTVTQTLSNFRRTHHDNWHDHKQMFTDDQLIVLTDLLVSPNYYA